jgi:hypothetical protein
VEENMNGQTAAQVKLHALLIGIDCYLPNELPGGYYYASLGGCVRDIGHVEEFLRRRFGMPQESILKLTATTQAGQAQPSEPPAQWPTYENMVAKFKELTAAAEPGDQVYIHYSGHGGRATTVYPDLKGHGGFDEALVPTDIGNTEDRYLRDVEVAHLLKAMVDKKLIVTVVLDSCHSGGATRGLGGAVPRRATPRPGSAVIDSAGFVDRTPRPFASKVAPLDSLASTWRSIPGSTARTVKLASGWLLEPQGYTLLAACRASESANEFPFDGDESEGALTYWLMDSLKQVGPGLTYKMLHERILAKVHSQFTEQTPQLEGEGNRLVFGSERVQPQYAAVVMQVDASGDRVKLEAGQAQGVRKGARFVVYPQDADLMKKEERLVLAEITDLGATESWATVTTRFRGDPIPQGAQAVLLDPGDIRLQRAVRVLVAEAATRAEVEKAIQDGGSGFVRLAVGSEPADFQVAVNDGSRCFEIWDSAGAAVPNLRPDVAVSEQGAAARVVQRLVHLAKYRNVRELDNRDPLSPLARKLVVELAGVQSDFDPANQPQPTPFADPGNTPAITVGEWTFLRVRNALPAGQPNDTSRILNVTVLDLQPDWGISQVYPSGAGFFEPLDPGQEILLPLRAGLPDKYDQGTDVLKVFATLGATDFRWLELAPLDQPPARLKGVRKAADTLEELLEAVSTRASGSRSLEPAAYPSREWTTAQVEVRIRKDAKTAEQPPAGGKDTGNASARTAPDKLPEGEGGKIMGNENQPAGQNQAPQEEKAKAAWTPEQKMQAGKEGVTALLGLAIVGATLYLAAQTFGFAGQDKMKDAKDVLDLMLGVAGVVIGYYFGRAPADARAAQAQEQANAATAQTEQVTARAEEVANQVDQVMDKLAPGAAAGRGVSAAPSADVIATDLHKIRAELRSLGSVRGRSGR